jgi:hypothetical protein
MYQGYLALSRTARCRGVVYSRLYDRALCTNQKALSSPLSRRIPQNLSDLVDFRAGINPISAQIREELKRARRNSKGR